LALAGLVGFSVLGCYLYYPPRAVIFQEMQVINTEVVAASLARHWDAAEHWIPQYEDWSRKLEISAVIRGQRLSDHCRQQGVLFRDALEQLEHAVEDRQESEARKLGLAVDRAYRQLRNAFRDSLPTE
jgi:hypothetical protein